MTRVGGCTIVVKGRKLVEILDSMSEPLDEARSTALFEQLMARRAAQEDKRASLRVVARAMGAAACALFASARAGAFRAFSPAPPAPPPPPARPLQVVESTRRNLLTPHR